MSELVENYLVRNQGMTVCELFRNAWRWDHFETTPTTAQNRKIIEESTAYRNKTKAAPTYVVAYIRSCGRTKEAQKAYAVPPFGTY